jgi:uncharacterized ferritin-like protein (DUF455 family)
LANSSSGIRGIGEAAALAGVNNSRRHAAIEVATNADVRKLLRVTATTRPEQTELPTTPILVRPQSVPEFSLDQGESGRLKFLHALAGADLRALLSCQTNG